MAGARAMLSWMLLCVAILEVFGGKDQDQDGWVRVSQGGHGGQDNGIRLDTISVLGREEGFPSSCTLGKPLGLRPYFTVYPNLSPNTDIIPFLTLIH